MITRYHLMALVLLVAGCASPIGVKRVGIEQAYQQINASALTGPTLSEDTRVVLRRYGLLQVYDTQPSAALKQLHEIACGEAPHEVLFALAEANYAAARRFEKSTWVQIEGQMVEGRRAARAHGFAAAVYAYLYLFTPTEESAINLYDPRARLACNLYNYGLAKALEVEGSDRVDLKARVLKLPMGQVTLEVTRPGFPWTEQQVHEFIAADEYAVRGLSSRTRERGLGMPLIAIPDRAAFGDRWPAYYTEITKLPVTAFLRVHGTLRELTGEGLKATLELYCPYNQTETTVNGQAVPLEADLTAPLAYNLEGGEVWRTEFAQFFSGKQLVKTAVYMPQPYEPGKIPVVFVHGTTGSPARWSEIFNTLRADPVLRRRYQFWYFIYNSGQPIAYSAMLMRQSLTEVMQQLDPHGTDAALQRMVLIGHSQGGLLLRLSVVHSGNRLWANVSDKSFDEFKLNPETRDLVQRTLFFEPLPCVDRAVFICTPHRGSFMIRNFVQNLTARLVSLPRDVVRAGGDLLTGNSAALPKEVRAGMPTSVANMKPGSAFLRAVADMPFSPDVKLHSIIAVKPGMAIPTGNDGVVAYKDAHLDNVESEFVVRDSHSCQNNPVTIEEVRRILTENLKSNK